MFLRSYPQISLLEVVHCAMVSHIYAAPQWTAPETRVSIVTVHGTEKNSIQKFSTFCPIDINCIVKFMSYK